MDTWQILLRKVKESMIKRLHTKYLNWLWKELQCGTQNPTNTVRYPEQPPLHTLAEALL